MAVNTERLSSILRARERRLTIPHYLRLDGSRYLLALILFLSLMSLVVLLQTGAVATQGYAISELQAEKTVLMRERAQLQVREARAQSLTLIRQRAEAIGLRPIQPEQLRYIEISNNGH